MHSASAAVQLLQNCKIRTIKKSILNNLQSLRRVGTPIEAYLQLQVNQSSMSMATAIMISKMKTFKHTNIFLGPRFCSRFSAMPEASSSSFFDAKHQQNQGALKKQGRRWSSILLYIPGAITFGLGTWQLFRRRDKIALLELRQKRLEQDPIPVADFLASKTLNSQESEDLKSLEFRKVKCEGIYDESKSIFVGPRSRAVSGVTENGYYLITPLYPVADIDSVQLPVLVNRGWVPRSWRDKYLDGSSKKTLDQQMTTLKKEKPKNSSVWKFWSKKPAISKDSGSTFETTKVVGVIRGSENPTIFMPHNDPESGQWFYVDVPATAQAADVPKNTLYIEEIETEHSARNPYPIPKDVKAFIQYSVMPLDHLNYALTWYSLSAATTFMASKRLKKK